MATIYLADNMAIHNHLPTGGSRVWSEMAMTPWFPDVALFLLSSPWPPSVSGEGTYRPNRPTTPLPKQQ